MIYIAAQQAVSGGDPDWADVMLLVQDGTDNDTTILDRSAAADSTTIVNYLDWQNTHQIFGANMLETRTIAGAVNPFTSNGPTSLLGRDTGDLVSIECWVNIVTVENYAPSAFFYSWSNASSGRIVEVGLYGAPPKLRIRNGVDTEIVTASISTGEHFLQLNFNGTAYTLDVDGVEVYSGTNTYGVGSTGDFEFYVASNNTIGSATSPSTRVYVTPLRFTKGVLRSRGSVPTALFPTF